MDSWVATGKIDGEPVERLTVGNRVVYIVFVTWKVPGTSISYQSIPCIFSGEVKDELDHYKEELKVLNGCVINVCGNARFGFLLKEEKDKYNPSTSMYVKDFQIYSLGSKEFRSKSQFNMEKIEINKSLIITNDDEERN